MSALPRLSSLICIFAILIFMVLALLAAAIRIVPESRRLAVTRLGRYIGEKGPGLVLLLPIIDRGVLIDMRDEMAKAQAFQNIYGAIGVTQTLVHQDGNVEVDGKVWSATSPEAIPPGTRVRITRVVLEVESI